LGTSELTEHELKILQFSADGLNFHEIQQEVGSSYQGVKNAAFRIRNKLGADSLIQAVAMAIRRKIIQ
jgi:DNA-binding NarL/FixJ family response regulator